MGELCHLGLKQIAQIAAAIRQWMQTRRNTEPTVALEFSFSRNRIFVPGVYLGSNVAPGQATTLAIRPTVSGPLANSNASSAAGKSTTIFPPA